MDAITHVFLAHAVALGVFLWWRRTRWRALAPLAGVAALAPDMDVFLAPLTLVDELYFLQHRGASHSLVGAPISAFLFIGVLHLLSRRFERLRPLRWQKGAWWVVLWGAWSHLILDVVTRQGIVPLWPFSEIRYSLEWFFYMVWWMAPISLVALIQRYRGKWDDARYLKAAAVVVGLLVVTGAVRVSGKPDGEAYSTSHPFEWIVTERHDNGTIEVTQVQWGKVEVREWYPSDVPSEAAGAVAAAKDTAAFRGFRMDSAGPKQVLATPHDVGWNVTIVSVVDRFAVRDVPGFIPDKWLEDVGVYRAYVEGGRVKVLT